MGLAMATNLQKHITSLDLSKNIYYHNRTMSRGAPLQEMGAIPRDDLSSFARSCDVIFLSVRASPVLDPVEPLLIRGS
jgi:3-hydroxyisobutyrate dehydrogenase-like beta-hydroxyacid dehydrogenase